MPRPHIEFIPSQVLPWRNGLGGGSRNGVAVRTLSVDDASGASSLVLRYPSNWSRPGPEHLLVDEELFVLEGELRIGNTAYGKHDYAHLPSGFPRPHMTSTAGAVVLTFFSAPPRAQQGSGSGFDKRRLVNHIDTRAAQAERGKRKHMDSEGFNYSGTSHKSLYEDPDSGDRTWLIGLAPYWSTTKAETHPVAEEEFAIYGDMCMPNGIMHAGAYFWRPPNIQHGPFGTVGGALHLVRGNGGAFATTFEDKPENLNWDPVYRPILPQSYRVYLTHEHIAEPNY